MAIKKSNGEKVFSVLNTIFLCAVILITLYPMLYVIFASFSNSNLLIAEKGAGGVLWHPAGFSLLAYKKVLEYPLIWQGYLNTIFYVVVGVFINVLLTLMSAYYLTKKGLMFQSIVSKLIVFTMFFNGGLVPGYLTIKNLGLLDSRLAIILPVALNTYNLMIMRTAMYNIPDSICESAEIDGANDIIVLFRIMVPVAMPTVAVMILYYGVGHWNSWFSAQIYLQDTNKWPVQLILRKLLVENGTDSITGGTSSDAPQIGETIKYAIVVVSVLPILAVYPFLQKYFVKGVMIGAVKG